MSLVGNIFSLKLSLLATESNVAKDEKIDQKIRKIE
jgi:hypothetical protein